MPFPSSLRPVLLALALAAPWAAASAQPATPAVAPVLPAGFSVQNVAVLAGTCANCHGTDGKAQRPSIALAGYPADRLVSTLKEFKEGKRTATIMHQIAKGYTDEQVRLIASYFAAQK